MSSEDQREPAPDIWEQSLRNALTRHAVVLFGEQRAGGMRASIERIAKGIARIRELPVDDEAAPGFYR